MKRLIFLLFLGLTSASWAQDKVQVQTYVQDTVGKPLPYATISLLFPSDSTLAFFGIANNEGLVNIAQVLPGDYVLQASYLGFSNYQTAVSIAEQPQEQALPPIALKMKAVNLGGVEVQGVQTPILIKKDTVEYNASSFRSKPTDNVEQLLKKMPGIEVDRVGNVKAQGEEVKKVLVDGKEFFGNDPKIATKNIPADAVDKVQVFDKQSDVAEFTGVDDGERNKTINLKLKEDKKNGAFGDATAGYGTDNRYQASGSLYKYNQKTKLSALARLNNINDYGFSISDYLNFKGAFMGSGGNVNLSINSEDQIPLNYGQSQNGNLVSGALGLNANHEFSENNNLNASYMYGGSNRFTTTERASTQFTPNQDFNINEDRTQRDKNYSHTGNLRWQNDLDSLTRTVVSASLSATDALSTERSNTVTTLAEGPFANSNNRNLTSDAMGYGLKSEARLIRKSSRKNLRNYTVLASADINQRQDDTRWNNALDFANQNTVVEDYLRNDNQDGAELEGQFTWNEPITQRSFINVSLGGSFSNNNFTRNQDYSISEAPITAAPEEVAGQDINRLSGEVAWKYNTEKSTLKLGLGAQQLEMNNRFITNQITADQNKQKHQYLLPNASLSHEFSRGKRINLNYSTRVSTPSVSRIAPFADLSNPLFISAGNLALEPEFSQSLSGFFMLYDAFSFTSVFANLNYNYIDNAIVQSKTINADGSQRVSPINFRDAQSLRASVGFNTPIKKLGIKLNLDLGEQYSQNFTLVNNVANQLNRNVHEASMSIENRKKETLDVLVGTSIEYATNRYSIQTNLNNNYVRTGAFCDVSWFLGEDWILSSSFDYSTYRNSQIGNTVSIPLWQAEVSRSFLNNKRGNISLKVFDILKQNQAVQQFASENFVGQEVSNILTRYAMLSFSYKLGNKGQNGPGGMDIDIRRR